MANQIFEVAMTLVTVKRNKKEGIEIRNLTFEMDNEMFSFYTKNQELVKKIDGMKKYKQYQVLLGLGAYQTKPYIRLEDIVIG